MCIGVPLQVQELDGEFAWCVDGPDRQRLNMMLLGPQPVGSWVLAFQGSARQALDEAAAQQMRQARLALAAVLRGETLTDAYFADLLGREPELPAHLQRALA
jgi:hydrogenase expression/formation protein HypC